MIHKKTLNMKRIKR